jgi:gliding motility-associated-like protein
MLNCFKRFLFTLIICICIQQYILEQLQGNPVNTTGWTMVGVTYVNGNNIMLCPTSGGSGAIYVSNPIDLNICTGWTAEFDYRMFDGSGADGIAMWFLQNPPTGFGSGGAIGMPAAPNGVAILLDQYDNGCGANPEVQIFCGDGVTPYNECSGNIIARANGVAMVRQPNYNRCRVTYNNGFVQVFINNILIVQGNCAANFSGYLGFSSSTGGSNDNHTIRDVTIYTSAPVSRAGNDTSICSGAVVQLGQSPNANYTYQWNPANYLSNTNVANPDFSYVNNTGINQSYTYIVRTDTGSAGCYSRDTVTITVYPEITANAGNDTAVCYGKSASLSASGGIQYIWASTASLSCTACANPVASPTVTETFIVTVTDINQCSDTDSVIVTVNMLPAADAGNNIAICRGDTTQLQASGGVIYIWSPGTRLSCIACDNPFASPIVTTTYRITVTDVNQCTNSDSVIVTVNPLPNVNFSGLQSQYCLLDSNSSLTGNPSGGTFSGTGISGTDFSPQMAGAGIHLITYSYTDNNNCSSSAAMQTNVSIMPQINFAGIDTTHCLDISSYTLQPQPPGGIFFGNFITGNNFNPQAAGTGYHKIYYSYVDNNNCSVTDSLLLRVDSLPSVTLTAVNVTCYGYNDGSVTALVAGGATPYNYLWNNNKNDTSIGNLPPGNYRVTITDGNGCTTSADENIFEPVPLMLQILPDNDSIILGDSVLYAISHNADSVVQYSWQPASWLSCSDCPNPLAIPQQNIVYTLTITDTNSCIATAEATVFIKPRKANYIPNIFSPNGDGINDILYAYLKGTKKITFRIYNRWGEKVFETDSPLKGWDGNYKGKEAEPGIYVYDVYAIYWDNEVFKQKGSITLVR